VIEQNAKGQVLSLKKLKGTILLLDVETVDDDRNIVELSGKVVNKNLIALRTFSFIIKETWEDKNLMSGIYAETKKVAIWHDNIKNNRSQIITTKELASKLDDMIKEYNIKVISAYNLKFDLDAILKTFTRNKGFSKGILKLSQLDLWLYAGDIFLKERYVKYCVSKNYLTPKGNCLTSAEVVYRYVSNDDTFIETHVALDDINIELEILRVCALHNNRPIVNQMQNALSYTKAMKKFF
jgi:hypothetical protein